MRAPFGSRRILLAFLIVLISRQLFVGRSSLNRASGSMKAKASATALMDSPARGPRSLPTRAVIMSSPCTRSPSPRGATPSAARSGSAALVRGLRDSCGRFPFRRSTRRWFGTSGAGHDVPLRQRVPSPSTTARRSGRMGWCSCWRHCRCVRGVASLAGTGGRRVSASWGASWSGSSSLPPYGRRVAGAPASSRRSRRWLPAVLAMLPALGLYLLASVVRDPGSVGVAQRSGALIRNALFVPYGLLVGTTYGPPVDALHYGDAMALMKSACPWPWRVRGGRDHSRGWRDRRIAARRTRRQRTRAGLVLLLTFLFTLLGSVAVAFATGVNWLPRHSICALSSGDCCCPDGVAPVAFN